MEKLSRATRTSKRRTPSARRALRLVSFLAPNLFWFYEFVSRYLAEKLQYPVELLVETDYAELANADMAFICGLPYVEHDRLGLPPFEPLAAPVLSGKRYGGKAVYFSDVIVRRESPFGCFADLRGRSWAYNEPLSQSGPGVTRYQLAVNGETNGYFSRIVEAGYHERAIQMVCAGIVDASAIDSHVLELLLRDDRALFGKLRVIDTFGPSPIQPFVARTALSRALKDEAAQALIELGDDPEAQLPLRRALVERFERVSDSTYDEIRRMRAVADGVVFHAIL
jgi:phosphonate transport system substrate-binding protein